MARNSHETNGFILPSSKENKCSFKPHVSKVSVKRRLKMAPLREFLASLPPPFSHK